MNLRILFIFIALTGVAACQAQSEGAPIEHGRVSWLRELPRESKAAKPVFLLFQEVPG